MSGMRSKPMREFMMCTTWTPRLSMKPRMSAGKLAPPMRSGSAQTSSRVRLDLMQPPVRRRLRGDERKAPSARGPGP